jgi:hypothetical protein
LRSHRHGIAETETLLPDDAGDAVAETELDLRKRRSVDQCPPRVCGSH